MRYDIFKFAFSHTFSMDKKCPFWAVKYIMYNKTTRLKVLHLSLTLFVGKCCFSLVSNNFEAFESLKPQL